MTVQTKSTSDEKHVTSNIKVDCDGKQLTLETQLQLSDISPSVDLKFKAFDGKTTHFLFKSNRISEKQFDGQVKLDCHILDILFEGNWDANIDVQDLSVKAYLNCPKLKINKINLEALSKPGKGDRKVQITLKSAGKNLLSGTTNYQTRDEQGKFIAEGSGSFKVKEESTSGNFKYISQQLSTDKNGEDGFDISLDINLGKRTLDSGFKVTNKQLRILNSYCEKPKECSRLEINSNLKQNGKYLV